jgi:hypothetical protein
MFWHGAPGTRMYEIVLDSGGGPKSHLRCGYYRV